MRGNFSDIIIMFQISPQHFDKSMPENLHAWAQFITYKMFAYVGYVNHIYFEYLQECQQK